jgi:hypothetical protein
MIHLQISENISPVFQQSVINQAATETLAAFLTLVK